MIPYGRQWIDEDDVESVAAALRSDWLTTGPRLKEFEASLAKRCDAAYSVACNSGTAALHMAYAAADIGPGCKVVVPANTFLATANAAIYLGAEVVFCDVDPHTGLMTPDTLAAVLDETISAVVPVHFAGQPCDMASIATVMDQHCPSAWLIEDASHAIGGSYRDGHPVGSPRYASMITFSFHPVKHVAAGEGGAVTTKCAELKDRLESFRCHGMTKDPQQMQRPGEGPWYYEMHSPGFNYRIPEASCALAVSQLRKLDRFVQRRRQVANSYLSHLDGLAHLSLPPCEHLHSSAWHLFCLHVDFDAAGVSRHEVMSRLQNDEIGTQVHYYPVALQPFYQRRYGLTETQLPGAVAHYQRALSIPMFAALQDEEIQHVIQGVQRALRPSTRSKNLAA